MAKKIILAIVIIILAIFIGYLVFHENSISVYIDGENVTSYSNIFIFENINTSQLNKDICNYTLSSMNNTTSNISTIRNGISDISESYGLENVTVNINSSIGENEIPIVYTVKGKSMYPTLHNGQKVLLNKTKNIHVGDIVVANTAEYGNIIKRVSQIDGDSVYLTSDNTNVEIEEINGSIYQTRGLRTWVDISNIYGVVIKY